MSIILNIFCVVVLATLDVSGAVNVSVYYESLCPDSVQFITRQLYPHYQKIAEYVDLELIPYGKAIHNEKSGSWEFSCQHGPPECRGNIYQSCVLSMNYGTEKDIRFVNCVMRKRNPSHLGSMESCARRFNMDVPRINSCATSEEGKRLLAANGDKTWKLDPSISFVPTVVYDDEFNQLSQDQSMIDFVAVVCSKINSTKPTICNNRPLPRDRRREFFLMYDQLQSEIEQSKMNTYDKN